MNETTQTIDKFDRIYGALQDVALRTKPSTIEYIEPITGRAETFVVQTFRTDQGEYIFLKRMDDGGVVRIVLPPKVVSAIRSHGKSLTKRSHSIRGKRVMRERMANGFVPNFKKKAKKK